MKTSHGPASNVDHAKHDMAHPVLVHLLGLVALHHLVAHLSGRTIHGQHVEAAHD